MHVFVYKMIELNAQEMLLAIVSEKTSFHLQVLCHVSCCGHLFTIVMCFCEAH